MTSYQKIYKEWADSHSLTIEEKHQLINLSVENIFDAFYKELDFGTGGLRGIMGLGTNRMNRFIVGKTTLGFANYLNSLGTSNPSVAISYDNRFNSADFARLAASILVKKGIKVYLYSQLRPTPTLSWAVRYKHCQGGIMITASHNPKEYNGYKVYNSDGAQLNLTQSEDMIKFVKEVRDIFNIPQSDFDESVKNGSIEYIDLDVLLPYLDEVRKIKINNITESAKFVFSPLHGTGARITPQFLTQEGYSIFPLESQMVCSPSFESTLSSNPEDPKAFIESIKLAKEVKADAILVTDPDADRLGVAVLHNNEYVLLNGNQTAAIELHYLVNQSKKLPKSGGCVYSTIVTTDLLNDIAAKHGHKIVQSLTGFKNICDEVKKNDGKLSYIFGCEESYGSLISDFVRDKDSIQACYLLCEIISFYKNKNKTLVDYLQDIYQEYGYYLEETDNFYFEGSEGIQKMESIMAIFRANPLSIRGKKLIQSADYSLPKLFKDGEETIIDIPVSNVLKYWFDDHSWIVLRPSGTEPKLKVYYSVRAKSLEAAKQTILNAKSSVAKLLEGNK